MNPRPSFCAYMDGGGLAIPFTLPSGRKLAHGRHDVGPQTSTHGRSDAETAPPSGLGLRGGPGPADRRDSFEAFFEDHRADLFGALYLITRNRHEAEEIMQDAFLKLLERWERVGSLADPVGYLYRTAMNLFRKRWRRASGMCGAPLASALEATRSR